MGHARKILMQVTGAVAHPQSAHLPGNLHRCFLAMRIWTIQGHCAPHSKTQDLIPSNDHDPRLKWESCGGDLLQLFFDCGSVLGALACSAPQGVSLRPQPTEAAGDGISSWLRLPQITARKLLIHASHPALCYRCCHHMACFLVLIFRKRPHSCFTRLFSYDGHFWHLVKHWLLPLGFYYPTAPLPDVLNLEDPSLPWACQAWGVFPNLSAGILQIFSHQLQDPGCSLYL